MAKKEKGKAILKRFGTALFIGHMAASIVLASFGVAAAVKSDVSTKHKYNQPAVVQELLEDFQVSSDYLCTTEFGYYKRIEYNKNAPIYVSFSKEYDEYPQVKQTAKEALEYVFGMINKINPNYTYKIVPEVERVANSIIGMSTIKFDDERIVNTPGGLVLGYQEKPFNFYDITKRDANYSSNDVVLDLKALTSGFKTYPDFYIITHELMHVFGFDDVYVNFTNDGIFETDALIVKRRRGDTFMDAACGSRSLLITPKDFAKLCALYMPKLDGTNYMEYKEKMEIMIQDYTKEYYQKYEEACIDSLSKRSSTVDTEKLQRPDNLVSFKSLTSDYMSSIYGKIEYHYNVEIIDGKTYKIDIFNKADTLLASCTGDVIKGEKVLIFKDCYFPDGFMPGSKYYGTDDGFIQDIICYNDGTRFGLFIMGDQYVLPGYLPKYNEINNEIDNSL